MFEAIKKKREAIYFTLILLFQTGLVCSKFLMSSSLILWALFFLLFGDYSLFRKRISENPWWWALFTFWVLHLVSMLWSTDMDSAWDGVRVRISLWAIPILVLGSCSLTPKLTFRLIRYLLLAIAIVIILNIVHYLYLINTNRALDIRQLSGFGSHIRFGILCAFSVFLAFELWRRNQLSNLLTWGFSLLAISYTLFAQTFSALLSLMVVLIAIALLLLRRHKKLRYIFLSATAFLGALIVWGSFDLFTPEAPCGQFKNLTQCKLEWEKKSSFDFEGSDRKNQSLIRTAERYICSQSRPLNSETIRVLSSEDIQAIENGHAHISSVKGGMLGRYYELKFQIHDATDPNGHSLLQRIEFWKASWHIVKRNVGIGVGIGDIDKEMARSYQQIHSPLLKENQRRSHNMYLTTWIGVGIIGLVLFTMIIGWVLKIAIQEKRNALLIFIIIATLTMTFEDSLETQAGASFFGYFIAILASKQSRATWRIKN